MRTSAAAAAFRRASSALLEVGVSPMVSLPPSRRDSVVSLLAGTEAVLGWAGVEDRVRPGFEKLLEGVLE